MNIEKYVMIDKDQPACTDSRHKQQYWKYGNSY